MMRSYEKSPLIFVILIVNLLANVDGQGCYNSGNSSSNSTYRYNIDTLLRTLSVNIGDNGFYNASLGQNTDTVYANALCRGDIQLDTCRTCVRFASDFLLQSCPNNRQSRWVDGYLCHVRYSNVSQFGVLDTSGDFFSETDGQNAMDPDLFRSDLTNLLNELWRRASNGGPLRKVAAGNTTTSNSRVIFAIVQCTPDLSQQNCESCLIATVQRLPRCCGYSQRAGAYTRSCFLRYQITPFYNETRLQELETVVPSSLPMPSPPTQGGNRTTTIIVVVVSVAAGLIIIAVLVCFYIMKMRRTPKEETEMGEEAIDDMSIVESLQYDFGVIKVATNDFSDDNKLGQGGFGSVYKGKLPTGQEIAVKRLSRGSGQGDLEFKNEVVLLVKLQHRNLVRLLGFSLEGSEKLLMYELVQNASLDAFIFDPIKRLLLDWDKRYKIIGGIARGILYLHEDSRLRIIHRDLKASNILLDGEMNPKIADFGMARIFVPDETHASTNRIVGTYGYMSPEYAMRGQFSVKSDVFSFGVLLLEIISGQRNNCFQHDGTQASLINSAWKNWRERTTSSLVDPVLIVSSSMPSDILRCIHIGLLCVQENATDRPTMASVIIMLNSLSINLPVPSHPGFYVHEGTESSTSQNEMSQSEMSVTEFHGR